MVAAILFILAAQEQEPEVVVTADPLGPPEVFDAPYNADVLSADDIRSRRLSRTVPEALREFVGVSVQRTGNGQASPFIRGVTGYRNLLLVDGIRLNNSTFRQGPVQYWGLVDRYMIDRLEVMRGPASYLYGSDSIGGTVVAYTREPEEFPEGFNIHPATLLRVSGGERSIVGRQEATANWGDLGIIGGVTSENYGDIEGGPHTHRQANTSYTGWDGDLKAVWRIDDARRLVVAWQRTDLYDHPRTHRTRYADEWHGTAVGTDLRLDFDNRRELAYAQLHWDRPDLFFDRAQLSVSFQRMEERESRTRANGTQNLRFYRDITRGVWARFGNDTSIGTLSYGFDWYHDTIDSTGRDVSGTTGAVTTFERGTVADETTYDLAGLYFQDEFTVGGSLDVTLGARLAYAAVDADEVDTVVGAGPVFPAFDKEWTRLLGSARAVYHLNDHWNLVAGVSQGFRAPTVHDLTAVDVKLSGATEVPSPNLDPERTITYEVGIRADHERWSAEWFVFYTDFQELIERVRIANPFAGPGEPATANQRVNFDDGTIYGVEIGLRWNPWEPVTLFGDFSYVFGESENITTASGRNFEPMDKVNPATAHVGVRYEPVDGIWWIEGLVTMVGGQSRLSPSDLTDTQRIPPGGTPGYTLFTIRGGVNIDERVLATLAVENIGDRDYRAHGSGTNEPGFNVIGGLEFRW